MENLSKNLSGETGEAEMNNEIKPLVIPRNRHSVSRKNMTQEVLKVLYRLKNKGHAAYLCGGGVRDLLLGKKPKDFDVATDARPGRLKQIFRNAWLVGKRFRLAHLVFKDGKIVEVSTFRRLAEAPETNGDSLMIHRDNTFGTEAEDAFRRDFTINALYYNIADFSIIDYVGGLRDIESGVVRAVGDPFVRFQEDPVRICRGIRFSVHLGFSIEENTWNAMLEHGSKVALCPPSRVQEELLRLMRGGSMVPAFRLLLQTGILPAALPEVSGLTEDSDTADRFWAVLEAMDAHRSPEEPYSDAMLWASLFLPQAFAGLSDLSPEEDPLEAVYECLREAGARMSIPKVARRHASQLLVDAWSMLTPPGKSQNGRRASRLFSHAGFNEALKLLEIYGQAAGGDPALVQAWRNRHEQWVNRDIEPRVKRRRRRKRKTHKKVFDIVSG